MNAEQQRLEQARLPDAPWKKWGPYLSERQWGTVREDYSDDVKEYYFYLDSTPTHSYLKYLQHFVSIASATIHAGGNTGMWDEQDGFFYDVLQLPDGQAQRLKVRSMVGLLPLCAVSTFEGEFRQKHPRTQES